METKQNLDLKLFFTKPHFFVDDFISGTLVLSSERPSIIEKIVFEIIMIQKWKLEGNQPFKNKSTICEFDLDLRNGKSLQPIQGCYVMPGGENKIPFKFKFTNNLFPCFEFPFNENYAFLRYHFNVKIYSSSFRKLIWDHYLCLISRPVMELQKELSKIIDKSIKKWSLIGVGSTKMMVTLPDNNFKYNSDVKINIFIDNTNGKEQVKEVKLKFSRIINYFGQKGENKFTDEYNIYDSKLKTPVLPGVKQNFECIISLRENMINTTRYKYNKKNIDPYGTSLAEIGFFLPTLTTPYITCRYELKATLYFNCFVGYNDRPRAIFPIYITHQTIFEYQSEIQNQIQLNNQNQINYYNNNKGNNIPSLEEINASKNNNIVTMSGDNMNDDYSKQYESAPAVFPEPQNNDIKNDINNNNDIINNNNNNQIGNNSYINNENQNNINTINNNNNIINDNNNFSVLNNNNYENQINFNNN